MKSPKSSTSYWVIRLNLTVLLKIIFKHPGGAVSHVSYIESNFFSRILLFLIKRIKRDTLTITKIKNRHVPAGPVLDMATVRNQQGETVIIDAFRRVQEMGSRLVSDLMESVENINPLRGDKNKDKVTALFRMEVAKEITAAVMMALRIHWSRQGSDDGPDDEILVIPDSPWCCRLKRELSDLNVSIAISNTPYMGKIRCRLLVRILKSILKVFGGMTVVLNRRRHVIRQDPSERNNRIMVFYRTGVGKNQRNDIPFLHGSQMPANRLLVCVDHPLMTPSDEELEWMKRSGIACVSIHRSTAGDDRIHPYRPGNGYRRDMFGFHLEYLKMGLRCFFSFNRSNLWFAEKYWHMMKQVLFWQHFFSGNNVSILVHSLHSEDNFYHCLAMARAGGIVVSFERSILSGYGTYLHHAPFNINFVTGSHSVSGVHASAVRYLVQTGTMVPLGQRDIEGLNRLKKKDSVVLSVFDELPNDWYSGDSIRQMYEGLFELGRSDRRFILLVKSKKPAVMKRLPEIKGQMDQLIREGKCIDIHWEEHVTSVAMVSDMAVCVPSTAAFECVLTGKPTLLFNPMRSALSIFLKNNGWNRRYFVTMEDLTAALGRFVNNRDDSIGDCSDLLPEIDSFRDGQGAARMGEYLMDIISEREDGFGFDAAMEHVSTAYGKKWGLEKIRVNG